MKYISPIVAIFSKVCEKTIGILTIYGLNGLCQFLLFKSLTFAQPFEMFSYKSSSCLSRFVCFFPTSCKTIDLKCDYTLELSLHH